MRVSIVGCIAILIGVCAGTSLGQNRSESAPAVSSSTVPATSATPGESAVLTDTPVATRQSAFFIPFSIDPAAAEVTEVQLFISANRGANWHLYARQKPSDGRFHVQLNGDGEYWFASRTVDSRNRTTPPGEPAAELRMIVDTQAPRLIFQATAGPYGDVRTSWEVQDENLDPRSFKIEFQPGPSQPWQAVSVDQIGSEGSRVLKGQSTWWPATASKVINLKAEIRDLAGNPAVVHKRLFLPSVVNRRPPPTESAATTDRPAATTPSRPTDPFALTTPSLPNALSSHPPSSPSSPNAPAETGAKRTPFSAADNLTTNAPVQSPPTAAKPPPLPGQFISSQRESPATLPPAAHPSPATVPMANTELPAGERPHMSNSKRFALEYDIDSVGPGGVAAVELWGTKDRGATWTRWGTDDDKQSPYEVTVDEEGVFGFRIVIVSKTGLASPAPQAGDLADLWVGVDTTPPTAQFSSVAYGEGEFAGRLDIRWEAADTRLGSRPVTLSFSERAAGPWTTIASGLPNSGQYYWPVDAQVPKKIYLRLDVRDEVGNTANHQLSEPISLEGLTPAGRIKGVHSARNLIRGATPTSERR